MGNESNILVGKPELAVHRISASNNLCYRDMMI